MGRFKIIYIFFWIKVFVFIAVFNDITVINIKF
jgi:hypothetical protein